MPLGGGSISATDIELIVLEESRLAFYNAEAGLLSFLPVTRTNTRSNSHEKSLL